MIKGRLANIPEIRQPIPQTAACNEYHEQINDYIFFDATIFFEIMQHTVVITVLLTSKPAFSS